MHVAGRLIGAGILPVSDAIREMLLAIVNANEKASHRIARLKAYHKEHVEKTGESYYPHDIFKRLIEESLFDIIRGHATY